MATVGVTGVTSIDSNAAAVTVIDVLPVTPFNAAESVALPGASAVASPLLELLLLTEVTVEFDDAQLT